MAIAITKPEAMIFDLDGTLFQTETLLLPAYRATFDRLREEGLYEAKRRRKSTFSAVWACCSSIFGRW